MNTKITKTALVVYESMFGYTEQVAQAIAEGLGESVDVVVVEVSQASEGQVQAWAWSSPAALPMPSR